MNCSTGLPRISTRPSGQIDCGAVDAATGAGADRFLVRWTGVRYRLYQFVRFEIMSNGFRQAELARHVLEMLAHGQHVPTHDAFQLRNWAVSPEDAMLSLEEIARHILSQKEHSKGKTAER